MPYVTVLKESEIQFLDLLVYPDQFQNETSSSLDRALPFLKISWKLAQ